MTGLAKSFNQIHITTRRVIQMTFITKQGGLLRSARRWGVLGLLLALAVLTVGYMLQSVSVGQEPRQAQPGIVVADQQLRVQLAKELAEVAKVIKVATIPDSFVFASRDDLIVLNAGIEGLEKIGSAELERGANIGLVYLAGKGPRGDVIPLRAGLPPGYYVVRAFVTRGATARAQLLDQQGKVVAEVPATVGARSQKPTWTIRIECCPLTIIVDFHWPGGGIAITLVGEKQP
jgi:hypothetical protein